MSDFVCLLAFVEFLRTRVAPSGSINGENELFSDGTTAQLVITQIPLS